MAAVRVGVRPLPWPARESLGRTAPAAMSDRGRDDAAIGCFGIAVGVAILVAAWVITLITGRQW